MSWKEKVLDLMDANGINQKQLSALSGITESSVSRYLKGNQRPRIDVLVNFAKALNVKVDYLLEEEETNGTATSFQNIATAIARDGNELTEEEKNKLILLILGHKSDGK